MKNIQIPEDLFYDVVRYVIAVEDGSGASEDISKRVLDGLSDKLQKIADRELFTAFKTAPTEEEKNRARQAYLVSRGIVGFDFSARSAE